MLIVYEDGKLIYDNVWNDHPELWSGLFSRCTKNGSIIKYLETLLPNNSICVIPRSDGDNFIHSSKTLGIIKPELRPFYDKAKELNKIFIICTLAQSFNEFDIDESIHYLYLPLDETLFDNGAIDYFKNDLIEWENKSDDIVYRGGCSNILRYNAVMKNYKKYPNFLLSKCWHENKNYPEYVFGERLDYKEFIKYKAFFIIDGGIIASNHMWGFCIKSIPIIISRAECWFTEYAIENFHYIRIKYDLSDFDEKIEWIKNNDKIAKKIGENAYEFAKKYFTSEFQKEYIKTKIEKIINKSSS